ncbi:hypothetical protein [Rhodopseudomonas pseudopalustris]|uniref:hypothetical protein n=1 Tax=Rhodopseudomonas pseudopalustris TaxID=1513892 RepID=UPI003F9A0472
MAQSTHDPSVPKRRLRSALLRSTLGSLAGGVVGSLMLASSAAAQMPNVNLIPELKSKSAEEIEQERIAEKAYRDSLRKIPDSKASSDPWGDVRGAEPARASAKPKNKTGNAAN